MEITRIKAPKFRVGRYVLNEYELRQLMLDVVLGLKPAGIEVRDERGVVATIRKDGGLSNNLEGLAISGQLHIARIKAVRDLNL